MTAIITICLLYMLALVAFFIWELARTDRAGRYRFLKNFKKGRFFLIYFVIVPLYWLAFYKNGVPLGGAFLLSMKACVETVVLKFDYNSIASLMSANTYFRVTIDIAFALVVLNAGILVFTLFARNLVNHLRKIYAVRKAEKIFVFVGCNEQNLSVMRSVVAVGDRAILLDADKGSGFFFDEENSKLADMMFVEKVAYVKYSPKKSLAEVVTDMFDDVDKKIVHVIVNTGDDKKNLIYVKDLSGAIGENIFNSTEFDSNLGLHIHAFGNTENASDFVYYVEKSNGRVHYVNKYKLIAMDFVGKYPLTEFMTEKELDYSTATVRNAVSVNVVMLGFGKTNHQILSTSIANNQFLTEDIDGELKDKLVKYFVYDKKDSRNDKNLNHDYYRYLAEYSEIKHNEDKYLPLPDFAAKEYFRQLDVNANDFYASLKSDLSSGEIPFNYIVIAYGTDLENLDFAEKISMKLKEWGLDGCTKLFVKIRDCKFAKTVACDFAERDDFIIFGCENDVVYNAQAIVSERNELMAKDRHGCYTFADKKDLNIARQKWYIEWNQVQRDSNIFACLSIKMKLQLLGFDVAPSGAGAPDASAEYYAAYEKDDPIEYTGEIIKDRKTVHYDPSEYKEGTLRYLFAMQEHQRWNAYMLINGYVPATIEEIKTKEKPELIALRRHANLTDFEGLKEFGKLKWDVIQYDYQLMDDVAWLLGRHGYKIIKKICG